MTGDRVTCRVCSRTYAPLKTGLVRSHYVRPDTGLVTPFNQNDVCPGSHQGPVTDLPDTCAVIVDEGRVFSTGRGAEWWGNYLRYQHPSHITYLDMTPGGGRVAVACDDVEHATLLAHLMVVHGGLPTQAVLIPTTQAVLIPNGGFITGERACPICGARAVPS